MAEIQKRGRPRKFFHLPAELRIEILARVGETDLASLANAKICSRKMKRDAEDKEVYRRAFLKDSMILDLVRRQNWLRGGELTFLLICSESGNPFKAYSAAMELFLYKCDTGGALFFLQEAVGSHSVSAPAAYLKSMCLLFSPDEDQAREGVHFLSRLKFKVFSDYELQRCREQFSYFAFHIHRSWTQEPSWLNLDKPHICPDRVVHREARLKDELSNMEGSNDCLACDAYEEMEFVLKCLNKSSMYLSPYGPICSLC